MPLNPDYVLAPSLEMYFVDKDTGLPLSGGKVYFYIDNTSVPKDVFTIVASGSDFTYTELPNPSILSGVGTFQDASGNNILPYYYPFDSNGDIQLYRIQVYNSSGVLQFTRVGWPNTTVGGGGTSGIDVTNFVPNGQFLLHNNVPASNANNFLPGVLSQQQTIIAQGGWSYFVNGSGTTDIINFIRFGTPVSIPSGNTRYAVNISNTVAGTSVTRQDLCLRFPDVNTFASTINSYNFYFEAEANGGQFNATIFVHKFFGTGGSPSAETFNQVGTLTLLNNTFQSYNFPILFGTNESSILGTNEDDYVEIIIRFPLNSTFNATLTDFAITVPAVVLNSFPQQTEAQQLAPSTAGWLPEPDHNGFSLYLPAVFTSSGMTFDKSDIGTIFADGNLSNYSGSLSTISNKMLADGSQYRYNDYSPLGIPYARLGNYLIAGGANGVPQYGTGSNFVTGYLELDSSPPTAKIIFSFNKPQTPVVPFDGGTPTGFTFKSLVAATSGFPTGFNFISYVDSSSANGLTAIANVIGVASGTTGAGNSSFPFRLLNNSSVGYQAFIFGTLAASTLVTGGAGKYIQIANTTTQFFFWFNTGTESAPSPGGTGVQVNLDPAMSAQDVAVVLANAIAGYLESQIVTVAGSLIPAGSYFQFTSNGQVYVVWYPMTGGIQPIVAGAIYIPITTVTSTSTAIQVAQQTQILLNKFYFAVPNLQGLFLRGYDPTGEWDIDYINRMALNNELASGAPGTLEFMTLQSHAHSNSLTDAARQLFSPSGPSQLAAGSSGPAYSLLALSIDNAGNAETAPTNFSVVWTIKY